ncbi:transcription factor IBH1-like [Olea europaea var. sylvestris]|uniref:transcription factor IBH1-like n=1 Tax=Olea europaea var. sylvestris TaxID=158386 RepID=UPI000C1D51F0|nr:transcription factor IBH1-like [Olea europaea var. sylvestris]
MTTQTTPSNPNSIKTRFTYRFVQALRKLNKTRSVSVSPSMKETYRRYHMIRVASYASMASAVGSRRAWSRTVLWKIRNRTLHRTLKKKGKIHALRRRKVRENPRNSLNFHRENDLKKLVPGGEGMDFCRLLNETAHYIKCLRTQVQIMNNIVDHCSN